MADVERRLLSVPRVARRLDVPHHRVYDLVRAGILPAVHLGRQVRVCPEALEKFIAEGGRTLPGPGGWRRAQRA